MIILAVTVPGDPGGTLIFTWMVSQGNSCEFGHYNFGYSLVRSPEFIHGQFTNNLEGMHKFNRDLYGGGYLVSKQAYNEYVSKLNSYHDPKVKVIKLTDG